MIGRKTSICWLALLLWKLSISILEILSFTSRPNCWSRWFWIWAIQSRRSERRLITVCWLIFVLLRILTTWLKLTSRMGWWVSSGSYGRNRLILSSRFWSWRCVIWIGIRLCLRGCSSCCWPNLRIRMDLCRKPLSSVCSACRRWRNWEVLVKNWILLLWICCEGFASSSMS